LLIASADTMKQVAGMGLEGKAGGYAERRERDRTAE